MGDCKGNAAANIYTIEKREDRGKMKKMVLN
jgi:hypothetical protein